MPMDREERERIAKTDFRSPELQARIDTQSAEFDAFVALRDAYDAMPAIVDDDYPRCRHRYESAVAAFMAACKANGRTL